MTEDLQGSPRRKIRVTVGGITLNGDYHIEWSRLKTQLDLLEWVDHLCGKTWVTAEDIEGLVRAVCKKRGWDIHGNMV